LDYAHNQGVVHRDIKPANIMMLADGRVKVTDFSIAQVVDASQTRTGVILGTPSYMSPEQVNGKRTDGRSDLFSLGIVAYELLSGARPFWGDSMSAILYAISHHAHTPLDRAASDIPACVKSIINRLLAKRPTKRFATAEKALADIHDCLDRLR
jgi:serine/threonine protein kinase